MTRDIMLSERHLGIVRAVLEPFRERLHGISIFGSRATGRARPNSDIDLVLFGTVSLQDRLDILEAFDESDLPVTIDLLMYDKLTNEALRAHIDRVALPLFAVPALDQSTNVAAE